MLAYKGAKVEASKIENIAKEVVYKCDEISEQADSQLKQSQESNDLSLASINTFTDTSAVKSISSISSNKREILLYAKTEPFLSRIVVEDEDGVQSTYFICRKTPINGVKNAVSYDAPLGRLASLEIGSDLSINNGRNIEVIEKAQVFLKRKDNQWDSINTILEVDESGPVTIKSLLPYLGQEEESLSPEEILASLIAEEEEQINVVKGRQKSLITKIQLRDQPILDQYQDEVFRLPLESQLFLTGPAGTGKTTTLIRRLGQKLSREGLDDSERHILQTLEEDTSIRSDDSWMMFTPTKLLKQYLKEAFSREKVPASDRNIQTWKNFSNDIAKNTFSILKSSTSSGFILRENLPVLNESASSEQIKWFVDFSEWQFLDYLTELEKSASSLKDDEDPKIAKIADELIEILNASGFEAISTFFINLEKLHELVLNKMTDLKKFSNEKISRSLILQMNTNSQFLDELSDMLDSIGNDKEDELEELDEDDSEESEDALPSNRNRKKVAMNAYIGAIKTKAKSISQKEKLLPLLKMLWF